MSAALKTAIKAIAFFSIFLADAHAASFQCKLWLLPTSDGALPATFPVPTATPDATFTANHIALFMNAPCPGCSPAATLNNKVGNFLTSAGGITNLKFSGLLNPVIGSAVNATTPTVNSTASSNGTFGVYIEFTGNVRLLNNEFMSISHDNGVSLKIDGTLMSGLTSGEGQGITEFVDFAGKTGVHSIDFVYVNAGGPGYLSFSPFM